MRQALAVMVLIFAALSAHAALTTLEADSRRFYLHLPGADSSCVPERDSDGVTARVECLAGEYRVLATRENGCERVEGPGYCGSLPLGEEPIVAAELFCANGSAYYLWMGSGPIRCDRGEETMRCDSFDGHSFAEASCFMGCGTSGSAGGCCKTGTAGCPPGLHRDDQE